MRNVDVSVDPKGRLHLIVDLTDKGSISKSGKTQLIASTEGNKSIGGPSGKVFKVGLNVYTDKD